MALQRHNVDTNVFIAMFERSDERAGRLLHMFTSGYRADDDPFLTSEITLAELLVLPLRQKDERLTSVYQRWVKSDSLVVSKAVDRDILFAAAGLRADDGSLRLPDAIHLATAMRFGCRMFLTFDARLDRCVHIVKPEAEMLEQLVVEFSA